MAPKTMDYTTYFSKAKTDLFDLIQKRKAANHKIITDVLDIKNFDEFLGF
jgi:hypothetical protein